MYHIENFRLLLISSLFYAFLMQESQIANPHHGLFGLRINRDINTPSIIMDKKHPLYLLKDIISQDPVFTSDEIIMFLSGLDCCCLKIQPKIHRKKTLNIKCKKINFDRCLNIIETNPKDEDIKSKILKLYYDSEGNYFLVQIVQTSKYLQYEKRNFKETNNRSFHAWIYLPIENGEPSPTNPQGFNSNLIIRYLSRYFNHKANIKFVNQFTAAAFRSIESPIERTMLNRIDENAMNATDLKELFTCIGGHLFLVKGNGLYEFEGTSIKAFAWIPEVSFEVLTMGNCIELDTSFTAINPYVFSVPSIIHRNSGIPLGLLVGPTECHELYSLLYNSMSIIDSELFQILLSKKILSDEHSSFECLQKRYGFDLYYCYVHLIRSFGAHSAISILVREVLFCKSEEEFLANLPRFIRTFNLFLEIGGSAQSCKEKFIAILGYDENGEKVERNAHMEPLYIRMIEGIPTTTNHVESLHHYINDSVGKYKNPYKRLAVLIQCIINHMNNVNHNIIRNLRNYIKNLKNFAINEIKKNPECISYYDKNICENSSCYDGLYYSQIYQCELPCIHQVMNKKWSNSDVFFAENFGFEEVVLCVQKTELIFQYIDDEFKPPKKNENSSNEPIDCKASTHNHFKDPYANMINRTFVQLKSVMGHKIAIQEVSGYACQELIEMNQEPKNVQLFVGNPDDYLTLLSVRIITRAYKEKGMWNKF